MNQSVPLRPKHHQPKLSVLSEHITGKSQTNLIDRKINHIFQVLILEHRTVGTEMVIKASLSNRGEKNVITERRETGKDPERM